MNKKDESRLTRSRLQKKYNLKNDTPISKLPKIMTPTDYKDFMQAIKYPKEKTNNPDQFINQKEKTNE